MLPILRTISVGGVLLAITILGLALIPPSRTHTQFAAGNAPARGALIDRLSHPEWRQFLMLSAIRRADEVEKLRDLPSTPNFAADLPQAPSEPESRIAGLPTAAVELMPEDETGSIGVAPGATIPIEIGAASTFELPVAPLEEVMPVTTTPVVSTTRDSAPSVVIAPPVLSEPPLSKVAALSPADTAKTVVIIRKRPARKPAVRLQAAQASETVVAPPPPFNIFQAFFASLAAKPAVVAEPPKKKVTLRRPRIKAKKTAAR